MKDLEDRKQDLFKKDPKTWGYTGPSADLLKIQSSKDKHKAFRFMLTQDTNKIKSMGDELNFYTNQCIDDVRRVSRDNGIALAEHFTEHAKMITL